jgi:hypothetical protein
MKARKSPATRSPIRRKPLRNPGESLQLEMESLFDTKVLPYVIATIMAVLFAVYEWLRWFTNTPPRPIPITILALGVISYSVYRVVTVRKQFRTLNQGLEGEKSVGQQLEELRIQGCRIFHDIIGDNFNIDHVVVSTKGIFVIETKTYSKPINGNAVATFDGEVLLINGYKPERDPVQQVQALSTWLQGMLYESTNRKYKVRGVVVLPEWYVNMHQKAKRDVWVLNPKALAGFINHEAEILTQEDVALISSRIINYMQNVDK